MYSYNNEIYDPFIENNPLVNVTYLKTKNWQCVDKIVTSVHPPLEEITLKVGEGEVIASPFKQTSVEDTRRIQKIHEKIIIQINFFIQSINNF